MRSQIATMRQQIDYHLARARAAASLDVPGARVPVAPPGARFDEKVPGTGLGLAIVRDLVSLYSGSIVLGSSNLGGLRAQLNLPAVNGLEALGEDSPSSRCPAAV